jgi:hypothetical protein
MAKKQTSAEIPRLAYSLEEAAQAIGRHPSWVYKQLYEGNLRPAANFGKRAMISVAELERFVATLGTYERRDIGRRAVKKLEAETAAALAESPAEQPRRAKKKAAAK